MTYNKIITILVFICIVNIIIFTVKYVQYSKNEDHYNKVKKEFIIKEQLRKIEIDSLNTIIQTQQVAISHLYTKLQVNNKDIEDLEITNKNALANLSKIKGMFSKLSNDSLRLKAIHEYETVSN